MKTLRYRIKQFGICCRPWKHWKGEIDLLPISAQTLFCNSGLPIDLVEMELKSEGWLSDNEMLLEVLCVPANLSRRRFGFEDEQEVAVDETENWTEADWQYYELHRNDYLRFDVNGNLTTEA